jgi:succinate-acetate transporter protein
VDSPPPRIFLRPIGSPLTLGMAGLMIGSFVQSGLELKWIASTEAGKVGLILLAVPFTLQLLASIFSYLGRDGAAGAATGTLSTTWLALALLHISSGTAITLGAMGLMLLASAGALSLSSVAVAGSKPLPAGVFLLAALRFALAGIYELSTVSVWQSVAGIVGLVVTGAAAYCLVAFELEDQSQRPVLPTLRRGPGRSGTSDGTMDGVSREAGVRQTT